MKQFRILTSLVTAIVCSVGCKKQEPPASPPAAQQSGGGVSVDAQADAAPPPPAPSATEASSSAGANAGGENEPPPENRGAADQKEQELIDIVFDAYRSFYADKLRYARDMDELVKSGYLKKPPLPPPGKKFRLDPKNFNVYLVPQ